MLYYRGKDLEYIRMISQLVKFLFGDIQKQHFLDLLLPLLFFISLCSATLFFFDSRAMSLFGIEIHFPVGLLFFPATYVISNIIQDRKSRTYANTVVFVCFLADVILVAVCWVIAHLGNRADYFSVFDALPIIMGATFIFLGVSSLLNTFIFELTKRYRHRSVLGSFMGFFASITAAEFAVTSMSMPLLFYHQGLKGNVLMTIFITVIYKIAFNFIAATCYAIFEVFEHRKEGEKEGLPRGLPRGNLAKV